ncbi:MAG: diphthine synthase [Nitrososphaeria archaeon]
MLVFVGLGLNGLKDITISGIKWIKRGDVIYLDSYSSLIPNLLISELEKIAGKKIILSKREDLEDNAHFLITEAKHKKVILLVPGDPFVATTHMQLRLLAINAGVKTKIVHSVSIVSAITGETGLFSYKFGRIVTITFPEKDKLCETPYEVLKDNLSRGLHTLFLLEIDVEKGKFMTIPQAITILKQINERKEEKIILDNLLGIGCARIGSKNQKIIANYLNKLSKENFGAPPYSLIITGKLHFIEAEALVKIAKAPPNILRG